MVYAKDMTQVTAQVRAEKEEQARKVHEEKMSKLIAKTREFCHSTLSKNIEDSAYKGINFINVHITAPDKDDMCFIVIRKGAYSYSYEDHIILHTLTDILTDHAYKYTITTDNFCTYHGKYRYQDKWEDGYNIHITW